ncbi:MAG: hypothetical protein HON04_19505 [Planctomicrobium sp.]|jgi:hypothetical protein|nr:hypothetical protein [Planctomicrobium sp.]
MRKFFTIYRLFSSIPRSPKPNPVPGNLILALGLTLLIPAFSIAEETVEFLKESQFKQAISRPFNANADRTTLHYLQRISQVQQIAILIDRRIDPTQKVEVAIAAEYFDEGIREFVKQADCEMSVVADTIFVGPPETALYLKTRIELARDEFDEIEDLSPKRQFKLLRRYELSWDAVSSPQEIIAKQADRYNIRIINLEMIPHDLWVSGTIAYPNFIEGSLMILSQYGLSFEWIDANQIRIVNQIPDVGINQGHKPKGMTLNEAITLTNQKFPKLNAREYRNSLLFTGTVEDHEAVAILIGEKQSLRQKPVASTSDSLRDVRFTFKMVEKPFGSLMATLKVQGIEVRYDAKEIQTANIDLGKIISLELNEATIHQLLEKSCEKVGLSYRLDGDVIELVVPEE